MMIQNGLFRNMKLFLYKFAFFLPRLLIIFAVYPVSMLLWFIIAAGADNTGLFQSGAGSYMAMLCAFSTMALSLLIYRLFYKYMISFGSTKKNFYIASLISIFLFSVLAIALGMVEGIIFGFSMVNSPYELLCLFILALFMGILGSFYGILISKNSMRGLIVFAVSVLLAFVGIIAILMYKINVMKGYVPGSNYEPVIVNYSLIDFYNISSPVVMVILIIAGIALVGINWRLVIKSEIKA